MRTLLFSFIAICSFQWATSQTLVSKSEAETETTTMYFIRHAEKDRSDKTNRNPNLIEAGKQRAEKWAEVFSNIKFDAIYSTDYNRTKETAQPTLANSSLKGLSLYDPRGIDGDAFVKANLGKTVLVVGHSNTTPEFVNAVIGEKKYEWIEDDNNANLYIVTISSSGDKSVALLKVN